MSTIDFNTYYYHRTTRKVIAAVGAMFQKMQVARYTQDGQTELERITVPLIMGQKEKYMVVTATDPTSTRPIKQQLPIMSLEFDGLVPDWSRKQQTSQYVRKVDTSLGHNQSLKQPVGVPYNINLKLSILVRHIEDGFQILEQILPLFTPDYNLTILLDPQMGIVKNFPVTIGRPTFQAITEGKAEEMRMVIWEIPLTIQGWYMGMTTDPAVVTNVIVNLYTTQVNQPIEVLIVAPSGNGTFQDAEPVFQGNNFAQATATGQVVSWDLVNKKLYVTGITGNFVPNVVVTGANTNSTWSVSSLYQSPGPTATMIVTPNPLTANATDYWTYHTVVNEYLG